MVVWRKPINNHWSRVLFLAAAGIIAVICVFIVNHQAFATSHDLRALNAATIQYYKQNSTLPKNLAELQIKGLRHSLTTYAYTASSADDVESRMFQFQICTHAVSGHDQKCIVNNYYKDQFNTTER